jgi:hypothetical protein
LPGRPEARFEAYARAYAGCGDNVSLSYRRSYARVYEAIACESHKSDDKYSELFAAAPEVVIGQYVRLEPLDAKMHLAKVYDATSGNLYYEQKLYEPAEVWGFLEDGPFVNPHDMHKSFVFRHYSNQAAFCVVQTITDRIMGVIMLSNDQPQHLSIQLEPPIANPSAFGSKEQLEVRACSVL